MAAKDSVFHPGEQQLQQKLGVAERQHEMGLRLIRDYMPDQHREFFAMLRTVHVGAVDATGHPWAIMRSGDAGFMASPNDKTLRIASQPLPGEPPDLELSVGAKISIVGIQFETCRRNRLNATVTSHAGGLLEMRVDQSYGNCPKYIQVRNPVADADLAKVVVTESAVLSPEDTALIVASDTLLIASRAKELGDDPRAGVDINHRGGMPGFVSVLDAATIQFPDYKGNNFYNTFGNVVTDDRVGLQFLDFETGTLLNVKGHASLVEDLNDGALPLMGRGLRIRVAHVRRSEGAAPIRYEFGEFSDRNPQTG